MDKLHVLYLNNTANNPELGTLIGHTDSSDRKIILQFFHATNNILTLDAWPRMGGTYNRANAKNLNISDVVKLDITGSGVHLGNCHLNAAECALLLAKVNVAGYELILFYPRILTLSSDGTNHIVYDIYGNSTLPPTVVHFLTSITSTANPSPPRPASEA